MSEVSRLRTDLALEAKEIYHETQQQVSDIDGVKATEKTGNGYIITKVEVLDETGAKAIGKPIGNYITIESEDMSANDRETYVRLCRLLEREIRELAELKPRDAVLVVGLGNREVTPDALGPAAVSRLIITRHMMQEGTKAVGDDIRPVCGISPGVLGITGIETGEIVRGVAERVKPDLIIAIDALASRKLKRVGTTIQLADTGIHPGSGIGNNRKGLNEETLGIRVIAIGVPTVVDIATVAADAIGSVAQNIRKNSENGSGVYKLMSGFNEDEQYELIRESMMPEDNFIVTPKDIDVMTERISRVIANGINLAMHDELTVEDIDSYFI